MPPTAQASFVPNMGFFAGDGPIRTWACRYKVKKATVQRAVLTVTESSMTIERAGEQLLLIAFEHLLGIERTTNQGLLLTAVTETPSRGTGTDPLSGRRRRLRVTYHYLDFDTETAELQALIQRSLLQNCPNRPKRLRVYVNPSAGKRKGLKLLQSVEHLFRAALVECDTTETTHVGHARELARTDPLYDYDGLLLVSGDGTVNEVINGVMARSDHFKPTLGLLPSGSTNTVVWSINGNADVVTSALRVILGKTIAIDLAKASPSDTYIASFLGYGFFAEVLKNSERHRWIGPIRYKVSGAFSVLRGRSFEADIEYLTMGSSYEATKLTGNFKAVCVAVHPCMTSELAQGIAPGAKPDDHCMHLIMVKRCSRLRYFQFLVRLTRQRSQFALAHVERFTCREVTIRPIRGRLDWNCDGELRHDRSVTLKVVSSQLRVFSPPRRQLSLDFG